MLLFGVARARIWSAPSWKTNWSYCPVPFAPTSSPRANRSGGKLLTVFILGKLGKRNKLNSFLSQFRTCNKAVNFLKGLRQILWKACINVIFLFQVKVRGSWNLKVTVKDINSLLLLNIFKYADTKTHFYCLSIN